MSDWTIENLGIWNEKIEALAVDMGLDFYPQEFEMCDYRDMLGYQSYAGMPARYPHWSFGKAFELQRTMYSYGVSGLSYEMVINSNPCLAYLMIDNPLSLQILTMAHVYGHNDFFKNNIHFSKTRAELALEMFKRHADRVRTYVETPGIGASKVEKILDAAHAIKFQCQRNIFINTISEDEQKSRHFQKIAVASSGWFAATNLSATRSRASAERARSSWSPPRRSSLSLAAASRPPNCPKAATAANATSGFSSVP